MRRLLLFVIIMVATGVAQNGFYTDRAIVPLPLNGGRTAEQPLQFAPVRVCNLPLTQNSPCLPLASITDINGNALTVVGGNFGQLTTDVTGRFSFGCTATFNMQIQVAASGSNTPQINYAASCPSGSGLPPGGAVVTNPVPVNSLQTINGPLSLTNQFAFTAGIGTFSAIQGPGFKQQIFTSSGTFTIPAGITQVKVTVVGGGGAGGGGTAAAVPGDGGSSSGTGIKWLSGLTPGNTLTVTVGAGGTGVSGASGNNGVASSVSSGTQTITTISANPGLGGSTISVGPGQGPTAGTGGDLNFGGNTGGVGTAASGASGAGGPSIFGGGGGGVGGNTTGGAGSAPGAGGGGGGGTAGNTTGGAGANGIVIFEWVN